MLDLDTFVTTLYVVIDTIDQTLPPEAVHPGPAAGLCRSEVLTLAILGQWSRFPSERAFWRYAQGHLRAAFPGLPHRSQFNRLLRHYHDALAQVALALGAPVQAGSTSYEILDGTGVPVRNAHRRGRGWLPGLANVGHCTRLGWYVGFRLLVACDPQGVITGFGFGPASTHDRQLAETFLALRQQPHPELPGIGQPISGEYLADTGFAGRDRVRHWHADYGAIVWASPQRDSHDRWPKVVRRQVAAWRQIIETVQERLLLPFRLAMERPHALDGFQARLAAKVALHNFCGWLNHHLGRPMLAIADLIDW